MLSVVPVVGMAPVDQLTAYKASGMPVVLLAPPDAQADALMMGALGVMKLTDTGTGSDADSVLPALGALKSSA